MRTAGNCRAISAGGPPTAGERAAGFSIRIVKPALPFRVTFKVGSVWVTVSRATKVPGLANAWVVFPTESEVPVVFALPSPQSKTNRSNKVAFRHATSWE